MIAGECRVINFHLSDSWNMPLLMIHDCDLDQENIARFHASTESCTEKNEPNIYLVPGTTLNSGEIHNRRA
jgi:hypothetical protein